MSTSPKLAPAGFFALPEKEQAIRMRKKQQIEVHWNCTIDQAIPPAIKPRANTTSKAKAKLGFQTPVAEWWRWSTVFWYKLENLAAMTAGKLPFAQALMQAEVSQRQQDYTHRARETVELLASDLICIIAELKERKSDDLDEAQSEEEIESENEDGGDEKEGENALGADKDAHDEALDAKASISDPKASEKINRSDPSDQTIKIKLEPDDETSALKRKVSTSGFPATKRQATSNSTQPSASADHELQEMKANIASLRAAAARLRHQAAQREAKAYRLEAEIYEREAGESA